MKKRIFVLFICAMMLVCLSACSKDNGEGSKNVQDTVTSEITEAAPTEAPQVVTEAPKKEITITFFNGDTQLGTLTAYENEPVTGYEQFEQQEGFIFQGWYKTPTYLSASYRDLSKDTFYENTKLFGSFKSSEAVADTRSWYVVGEGQSPVLAGSGWAGSSVEETNRVACQLQPTGNTMNEFSITLDLFEGDKFQVVYDWQWDGQKGYGRFSGLDSTYFENGGGLSGEKDTSNVCVLVSGNYTITIISDPQDAKQDVLTCTYNGEPVGGVAEVVETVYEINENTQVVMKGSWVADWSENVELERVEGTANFVGSIEVEAGTEFYFMIWDNGVDTGIGMNSEAVVDEASKALLEEAYNVKVLEAGNYTFTVDAEAKTITVAK